MNEVRISASVDSSHLKTIEKEAGLVLVPKQIAVLPPLRDEPVFKRPLDFTLALFGLVLSLPLWILIAVAIKLEGWGPVFYRQTRWGRGGKLFGVLKFRTMEEDSDTEFGIVQAQIDDARVTKVGRFLRAMGLDELPQFINILRGEMSFVGPRALALKEIVIDSHGELDVYEEHPEFFQRLSVRPGLTGAATIYLPKDADPRDKFEMDLKYIELQSFGFDVRLILLSIWISVRGKWESRDRKF